MNFNIGDTVYRARAGQEQVWITCPECLGSSRLRVIMGDNTEVSIACVCCERGYEGSPGKIQTYQFVAKTTKETITGIEVRDEKIRYSVNGWTIEESDMFITEIGALTRAAAMVQEHEAEEIKRLKYKEKNTKTWAWNVSYWRGEIRRSKETIARCEARLAVAPKNPKVVDKQEASCQNS